MCGFFRKRCKSYSRLGSSEKAFYKRLKFELSHKEGARATPEKWQGRIKYLEEDFLAKEPYEEE